MRPLLSCCHYLWRTLWACCWEMWTPRSWRDCFNMLASIPPSKRQDDHKTTFKWNIHTHNISRFGAWGRGGGEWGRKSSEEEDWSHLSVSYPDSWPPVWGLSRSPGGSGRTPQSQAGLTWTPLGPEVSGTKKVVEMRNVMSSNFIVHSRPQCLKAYNNTLNPTGLYFVPPRKIRFMSHSEEQAHPFQSNFTAFKMLNASQEVSCPAPKTKWPDLRMSKPLRLVALNHGKVIYRPVESAGAGLSLNLVRPANNQSDQIPSAPICSTYCSKGSATANIKARHNACNKAM